MRFFEHLTSGHIFNFTVKLKLHCHRTMWDRHWWPFANPINYPPPYTDIWCISLILCSGRLLLKKIWRISTCAWDAAWPENRKRAIVCAEFQSYRCLPVPWEPSPITHTHSTAWLLFRGTWSVFLPLPHISVRVCASACERYRWWGGWREARERHTFSRLWK